MCSIQDLWLDEKKLHCQRASFTVEACILVPLLILLWLLLIRTMLFLYGRSVFESGFEDCILIDRVLDPEEDAAAACQKLLSEVISRCNLRMEALVPEYSEEKTFLYTSHHLSLTLLHRLWGTHEYTAQKSFYETGNASLRNRIDLIWELGEETPGIGPMIRDYQEKIAEWKGYFEKTDRTG